MALAQAQSVNSDFDIPVNTPLNRNSVAAPLCPNDLGFPVPEGKTSERVPDDTRHLYKEIRC